MKLKLFGLSLFEVTKDNGGLVYWQSTNVVKESKIIPDFYKMGNGNNFEGTPMAWQNTLSNESTNAIMQITPKVIQEAPKKPEKEKLTPKGVHELKLLHDETFKLNTDLAFVDEQVQSFKDKLAIIKTADYDMRRGTEEIGSMLLRLENRKKYDEVKATFEQFPYTTGSRIEKVLKENDYLQMGQVEQFLADMPKDAVEAMKTYNKACDKLCKKQAVFYIIADKKDFQKTNTRRDPILLAQSPFGHFWQILGAWDKEMIFLEQL